MIRKAQAYVPFSDSPGLADIIENFMKFMLQILGMIGIIAFVVCGIIYLTSAGDEDQAERGKRYLWYCVIGLVVGIGAFVILSFINEMLS